MEEVKEFMHHATNVKHWNRLREIVKLDHPELVNNLDASGLIVKVLKNGNGK